MRTLARQPRISGRPRPWQIVTLLLTTLAVGSGVAGWVSLGGNSQPATADELRRPTTSAQVATASTLAEGLRPTELEIPAIDVSTSLVSLGLNPDQTVEVPSDPEKAGWYRLGSAPGSPGSAVILGHVDSTRGPAVFYRLRALTPGAQIAVGRADGTVARFVVRSVATYPNDRFPAAKVYRNRGAPTLTLVTCGGSYDAAKGGYQANVVVTAGYLGPGDASARTGGSIR